MCCFSQPIELVSNTRIFARGAVEKQHLVYSMTYAAATDLAMVLPLPCPPNSPENAVRFINLERYPTFFDDMARGFHRDNELRSLAPLLVSTAAVPKLVVHDVGKFEASFVPRIADFDRLDERFRIPRVVWDRIPEYHDYAFAVFKLKGTRPQRSTTLFRRLFVGVLKGPPAPFDVHPMALEFPRRNPELLYFPTVHIHDRKVPARAEFDHELYCQAGHIPKADLRGWQESSKPARWFVDADRTERIVEPDEHSWRRRLVGKLQNADTTVGKGGFIPS